MFDRPVGVELLNLYATLADERTSIVEIRRRLVQLLWIAYFDGWSDGIQTPSATVEEAQAKFKSRYPELL